MKAILLLLFTYPIFQVPLSWGAPNSLTVTGSGSYNALNLTSNFNASIATTVETWSTGGNPTYTIIVHSSNGGLKNGSSLVPYTVTYACTSATVSTVTISTSDQTISTRPSANGTSPCNGTISIAYTGVAAANLYQGTFTDTLTFCYYKTVGTCISSPTLVLTSSAIPAVVSLTVSANGTASSLPMTSNQTDLLVGSVTEVSNSSTGYNILVKSTNGGLLKSGANTQAYTIKYGSSAATSPTTTNAVIKTVAAGYYSGNTSNVTLSYTLPGALAQGTYSDVLTFTIAAQ